MDVPPSPRPVDHCATAASSYPNKPFVVVLALTAFCALLTATGQTPARAEPHPIAVIVAQRGPILCERAGATQFRLLTTQTELFAGDTIETGTNAEADLLFTDGSQVKLNANSGIVIKLTRRDRPSQSFFRALVGVIWAHLRPQQSIDTPSANIVVRGTEVLVDVTPERTILTVTGGDATLSNAQGSVDVAANQQSTAAQGQAPTPPVAVDVTGLVAWTADVAALPLEFEVPGASPEAADAPRLEAATRATPSNATAWNKLGGALRAQGDLPGALDAYARATQLDPANTEARVGTALTDLSQDKDDAARDALAPVADQAQPLAVLGLTDLHEGKGADAVTSLTQAIAKDPSLITARSLLALALLSQYDCPRALATAQDAARRAPNSAQAAGTLAIVAFFAGSPQDAEPAARRAVRLNPLSPFALLAEGRVLLAQQDLDGARADYEKAAAIAPRLWLAHQELGMAYLSMDMPRKAEEEDTIALALNPRDANTLAGLGLAAERQGRYAEAEADHKAALALDPKNVAALYDLGALYVRRGELGQARHMLEQAAVNGPDRGVVYARLAEISLYRQDLSAALEFARRGVSLSPSSSLTHYELGRVFLEQDRTVQSEQEFREAVALDSNNAAARFALGLTQEKTDNGLLTSYDTLLGSATVGSPGTTGEVQNLATPGENQRIQAAVQDPTAIRVASRSYGNTQIDGEAGELGTRDEAASYLSDTSNGRGVAGVDGEEQATNGVRTNADSRMDTASFVVGQKAANSPSAFFLTGDYEDLSQGADDGVISNPVDAIGHNHVHLARAIAGTNLQSNTRSRVRAIFQISKYLNDSNYTDYSFDYNKIEDRSISGEVRWDQTLNPTNTLITGLGLGNRTRHDYFSTPGFTTPTPPISGTGNEKYQPYQAYVRDEARLSGRLGLIGEVQVQKLDYFRSTSYTNFPLPPSDTSKPKTFVLPNMIADYRSDARSEFRLQFRRLFATITDFQLLTPTDVFLISFAGLPQTTHPAFPSSDGYSTELEYDHTFANASFLSLAAAQQDIRQGDVPLSPGEFLPYAKAHVKVLSGSYEGVFSRDLSFALTGNFNYAHDSETSLRIAQVPDFDGLATLQYLNRAGVYVEAAYYDQGNRVSSDIDRSDLGGFGVLNLRAGKRFGLRTNMFVQLNNVLNKAYDVYGVLQPNRQLVGGVTLRF